MISARTHLFGDMLRAHRQAAGLTQEQLAERAGLSLRAVGDLERGAKLRPQRSTIQLLSGALGLSAEQRSQFEAAARSFPGPPLPAALPAPLAAAAAPRHNLPAALTSFVGRTPELAEVIQRVATQRLVTLTGAGGVGKTRLATEAGIRLVQDSTANPFADGVWLVGLAELARPTLLADALIRVFKLPEQIGQTPLERLQEYLAGKHLLLILDNCEHLIEACAAVVEYLLQRCWHLHVLATSREELRIPGETVYPVLPLALPDPLEANPEQLLAAAAAQLFVERIAAGPLPPPAYLEDAVTIAHICRQLDGMPLALELAAALTRSLSLSEIAGQLHDQMALLTNTYRNAIPRHQTMHSALVWSYQLLAPAEQQLLDTVSVFAGGWTLAAAQAVCAGPLAAHFLPSHEQLVAKSLVLGETLDGQRRYRLLEPVRQFAWAQLGASGERGAVCRRHAAYFLALAEQAEQGRDTPREREWLQNLEPERANLREVNTWAIEQGEIELAHRFNGALFAFWIYRSSATEARHWMDVVLALRVAVPTTAALTAEALALDAGGYIAVLQQDFAQAQTWFERELAMHTAMHHQAGIAKALRGCGFTAMLARDLVHAQHYTEQSLRVSRSALDRWGEAWSLFDLGYLALVRGEIQQAQVFLEEALPDLRAQGNRYGTFRALLALGRTLRLLDDPERARGCYREALHIQEQMHYLPSISDGLEDLAGMAAVDGDPVRAARLFGAAQAHRDATTAPRWHDRDATYARDMVLARSLLDADAWREAWAAGCAMPLAQAVSYALAERSA